jgi:hypothetical protein
MWWAPTSMTEKGLFILGGPGTHLHDILWAIHFGKNHGRSEGEENFGEFPITVGGRGRAVHGGIACFSRTCMHVCARRWALTEPERGVRLLNPSDCTSYVTEPERSIDPWLLTKPNRGIPLLLLLTEADRTCCLL